VVPAEAIGSQAVPVHSSCVPSVVLKPTRQVFGLAGRVAVVQFGSSSAVRTFVPAA
jgi:hypothetical protein